MGSPEYSGIVENAAKRTAEAGGVVLEAVKPLTEYFLDILAISLSRWARRRKKIRWAANIVAPIYLNSLDRHDKRMKIGIASHGV